MSMKHEINQINTTTVDSVKAHISSKVYMDDISLVLAPIWMKDWRMLKREKHTQKMFELQS